MKRKLISPSSLYTLPLIVLLLVFTLFPLIFSLIISFSQWNPVAGLEWKFIGGQNYVKLFIDERFLNSLIVTAKIACAALSTEFLLGLGLALLFNKLTKGQNVLIALIASSMATPAVVAASFFRMFFHESYGEINKILALFGITGPAWLADMKIAPLAIIIIDVWQWTPFFLLMLLAGIQTIPKAYYESAEVDGAGTFQIFRRITFPSLIPFMSLALLLRLMDLVKLCDSIFVLTYGGPGSVTETAVLYDYKVAFTWWDTGYAAAISYVLLAISLIICMLIIRNIRRFRG